MAMKANPRKQEIDIMLTSLGLDSRGIPESESYTLQDAKDKVISYLSGVRTHYNLSAPNTVPIIVDVLKELIQQAGSDLDLRLVGPILEVKKIEIANRKHNEYTAWKIGAWAKVCQQYEKEGELRIPLVGALEGCKLIPIAKSGNDSTVLTDWVTVPLADQPSFVRSCPRKHYEEIAALNKVMEENRTKNPHSIIEYGFTQGGVWDCGLYQALEREPHSLSVWVERSLRNRVQTFLELPRCVVLQHWSGDCLYGLGENFFPAYKVILTDEVMESIKAES